MKKQILIAALGFVSMGSFAQTFHEVSGFPSTNIRGGVPACYLKDGNPCILVMDEYSVEKKGNIYVYDENLSLVKSWSVVGDIAFTYFTNANNGTEDAEVQFTQTLFNDDDSFEYFIEENNIPEDGIGARYLGLKLMSDNGKELARFPFEKPCVYYSMSLLHFDKKDYLLIEEVENYGNNEDKTFNIYSIEKSSNGQTAIQKVPQQAGLSVFPSLARRNENVSIQLGNHAGGRLQVTSSNGSIVRQMPIQEGQTSMQLNTRGLSAGMYVVSVVDANGTQENCKIVIR